MIDRQTIVTLAVKGRYTSKPRPWVIVQSDEFSATDSVVVCAFTHHLIAGAPLLRVDVAPTEGNGLRVASQVQVEKIATVRREDLGSIVGRLEDDAMQAVETALRDVLGLP